MVCSCLDSDPGAMPCIPMGRQIDSSFRSFSIDDVSLEEQLLFGILLPL